MGNEFEKNHYFPKYNLEYWKKTGSKLYDKQTKKSRNFNPSNNFYLHKFYYFDGTPELEKRLGKIENYMSQILKKISNSITKSSIELSEYEINFIQLFLFLQAYRQLNTTEVIKNDETDIYQSNNYLLGTHNLKSKKTMEKQMYSLVTALEGLIKKKSSKDLEKWMGIQIASTHLVIAKNSNNQVCQSDVCCIIENDIDSNHLYTYFPQTPNISFFLVKSKYFYTESDRQRYLKKVNDEIVSPILQKLEKELVCQYQKERFSGQSVEDYFSIKPSNFLQIKENKINLIFFELPNDIVNQYNKILFDDGIIFIHSQPEDYISFLETVTTDYRKITYTPIDNQTLEKLFLANHLTLKDEINNYWEERQLLPLENLLPTASKPKINLRNLGIFEFDIDISDISNLKSKQEPNKPGPSQQTINNPSFNTEFESDEKQDLLPEYNLDREKETYYNIGQNSGSSSESDYLDQKEQQTGNWLAPDETAEQVKQVSQTQDSTGMTEYFEQQR